MTTRSLFPGLADVARLHGVRGVLVTSLDDALPIESFVHVDVDAEALAAIGATLALRARQAADTAAMGSVRTITLEGESGRLMAAARGRLLVVLLAERLANPGMLRLTLLRALEGLD